MRTLKFKAEKDVLIAGHRGYPTRQTENTLASFQAAVDAGVDMIETDIRITKDNHLILVHENSVERTDSDPQLLREMTFEEVKALRIGKEKAQIPTLEELLNLFADNKTLLYDLEIKVYSNTEGIDAVHYTVDQTVALCRTFGICNRVLFNSFDAYVLEYIHKKYGNEFLLHGYYPLDIMNMKNITQDPLSYLDYACFWIPLEEAEEPLRFLIKNGVAPCTYRKNMTEKEFRQFVRLGCAMFTDDDPEPKLKWRENL